MGLFKQDRELEYRTLAEIKYQWKQNSINEEYRKENFHIFGMPWSDASDAQLEKFRNHSLQHYENNRFEYTLPVLILEIVELVMGVAEVWVRNKNPQPTTLLVLNKIVKELSYRVTEVLYTKVLYAEDLYKDNEIIKNSHAYIMHKLSIEKTELQIVTLGQDNIDGDII